MTSPEEGTTSGSATLRREQLELAAEQRRDRLKQISQISVAVQCKYRIYIYSYIIIYNMQIIYPYRNYIRALSIC